MFPHLSRFSELLQSSAGFKIKALRFNSTLIIFSYIFFSFYERFSTGFYFCTRFKKRCLLLRCISWVLFGSFLRSVSPVPFPSVPDGPVSVCFSRALLVSPPLLSHLSELAFRWGLGGVIGTPKEEEMHFLLYQNYHKGQINTVNLSKHARLMCFLKIRV